MRVNTHISTKEKRRYALDHLGGVDFSSSPLTCAPTRSPDAVNWIGDHGINRKRHGWEQVMDRFVYETEETIEGIIKIPSKNRILIATSLRLHSVVQSSGKWIVNKTWEDILALRAQAFFNNGRCYIVGAGKIRCYNIEEDELEEIDPYIPTTTINIGHKWLENDIQSTLDPVNLLTRRRKNTLVGVEELPKTTSDGTKWVGYYLDSAVVPGATVTIEVLVRTGDEYDKDNSKKITITNDNKDELYYYEEETNRRINCGNIVRSSNANGRAVLQFTKAFPPPIADSANITVEFEADVDDKSDLINGCTFGTLFGVGGRQDRLFLSGNKNYPNLAFFSEENDFTYFPDIYTAAFGTDAEPITGMMKLSDDVLAVMKRNAIYYQSGEYYTVTDDSGNLKKMLPKFTITQGSISEGCLNPYSCANFGNDNVFLSSNGVYSIDPTSNVLTNTRVARERSYPIASRLSRGEGKHCFAHGQRLYVSDGSGGCYVADSAYKYKPEGSETYSYEWWYLDNIPARVWAEVNGELWFGTSDGRVCRFTEGYCDTYYDFTSAGDISIEGDYCVINRNAISEKDIGKRFKIETQDIYATYEPVSYTDKEKKRIYIDGKWIYTFSKDAKIGLINTYQEELTIESYTVSEIDITEGWIKLKGEGGVDVGIGDGSGYKFLLTNSNAFFRISNVFDDGKNYMTVSSDIDDDLKYGFVNVLGKDFIIRIYTDTPVVAEWSSPPLDFGSDSFSKTLFSITVTAETGKNSLLEFGYETRKKADSFLASGLGVFSFEDMDFASFSFENGFQSSYTVRARDRDFNFLRFCLRSDGDKPCAVHRISALYKINKKTKGVM